MVGPRRAVLCAAVAGLMTVASCTASGSRPPAAPTSAATPAPSATPTCATPVMPSTAPTDFPHAALTRRTASGPPDAQDTALARQGLAALTAFGGPISASAFQHYLDASGAYLTLPVDQLLTADPAFITELDGRLVAAATSAVARATTCAPATFSSGWIGHADVANPDWRYTLGRFYIRIDGSVTRAAPHGPARVTYRAAVGDTYNFDPGSTFAQFEQLALNGHAADFLDGGVTTSRTAEVTSADQLASPGFG